MKVIDVFKAVNKVLDALSQDGFSSAQDVISTLQGVKDIVCVENGFTIGSTSSSVDFSGDYIIRFGRTESSSYNLAVIEAVTVRKKSPLCYV
uniref:Uncharacterized protein n=1 Tax=Parascaris equorum TaxID=6256 RepID=A0A914RL52_PAREQ